MSADEAGTGFEPTLACPLVGLFEECTIDGVSGVRYCDDFEGENLWGPCMVGQACELSDSLPGCQSCDLVGGVPTIEGSASCVCEGSSGLSACPQRECVQRWEYSCGDCQTFEGGGDCFSYGVGCASPWLGCSLGKPCDRVWAQSDGAALTTLEDEAAALCVLTALRDRTPGEHQIIWGEMGDEGWVSLSVYVSADGTAVTEWRVDCPGCFNFGVLGRTGALELQPADYFDVCLADPSPDTLITCIVGFLEYDWGQPPPDGYVPPFTTGTCVSVDPVCPSQ